jgi:hypothetical protein
MFAMDLELLPVSQPVMSEKVQYMTKPNSGNVFHASKTPSLPLVWSCRHFIACSHPDHAELAKEERS